MLLSIYYDGGNLVRRFCNLARKVLKRTYWNRWICDFVLEVDMYAKNFLQLRHLKRAMAVRIVLFQVGVHLERVIILMTTSIPALVLPEELLVVVRT